MIDFNEEVYVVDFQLKDGKGLLKDCSIFRSLDKEQFSINDLNLIEEALTKDRVYFQNRSVNGCTLPRTNVEKYHIHKITLRDF